MRRYVLCFCIVLALGINPVQAKDKRILLTLPAEVLSEAVAKSLPLEIDPDSESVAGQITIQKIDNLSLLDNAVTARVVLHGNDIQVNTSIGGHQLRLNVGDVDFISEVMTHLRYDKATRTLFIKPVFPEPENVAEQSGKDVGSLLIPLFNNQEIPVVIGPLDPITTDTGSNKLVIGLQLDDIVVTPEALLLFMESQTKIIPNQ